MGNWMTYGRVRHRNGLDWRPRGFDWGEYPYPPLDGANPNQRLLTGDLNRMEQDYLDPVYPEPPFAYREPGSSPSERVAEATGVDIETVRKVLRYVFLSQE